MKIYILQQREDYLDGYGCLCEVHGDTTIGYYSSKKNAQEALKKAIEMIKSSNNKSYPWHAEEFEDRAHLFTANYDHIALWITEVELDSEPNLGY